jgi:hypothetical protein
MTEKEIRLAAGAKVTGAVLAVLALLIIVSVYLVPKPQPDPLSRYITCESNVTKSISPTDPVPVDNCGQMP